MDETPLPLTPVQVRHISSDKSGTKFKLTSLVPRNKQNCYYDYEFAEYDYKKISKKEFTNSNLPWFKHYATLLPFEKSEILSMGEGGTPLVASKEFANCFFKEENRNPSGCFKDREHAVLMPYLKEKGIKQVVIVSSGNAALSASMYGRLYKIKVDCVIPKRTSLAKKELIQLFGGTLIEGGDDFEECYHSVLESKRYKNTVNISAGIQALKDQGTKIIAFELYEEIGVPDYVVIPSANGSLLYGIYQGFKELQKILGITKMPILVGVQMKNAAPLEEALKRNKQDFFIQEKADLNSLAEGIVAKESYCSPKALFALRESKGWVETVSNHQLEEGMRFAIEKEGLLPEWTAASGFAALLSLKKNEEIPKKAIIVVINTGSGLKEIDHIAQRVKKLAKPKKL